MPQQTGLVRAGRRVRRPVWTVAPGMAVPVAGLANIRCITWCLCQGIELVPALWAWICEQKAS